LPADLFDHARAEGAGALRVLWQVVLPLSWLAICSISTIPVIFSLNSSSAWGRWRSPVLYTPMFLGGGAGVIE